MAVLQAQKNPPRRAGLGEGTGLNGPKRAIRNVPINGIFRAQTQDMFFLRSSGSDGGAASASGVGDRTKSFSLDQRRSGEGSAEDFELSSVGSPTGVPSS